VIYGADIRDEGGYFNNVNLADLDAKTLVELFMANFGTISQRQAKVSFLTTLMQKDTPAWFKGNAWQMLTATPSRIHGFHSRETQPPSHNVLNVGELYLKLREEVGFPRD
jgi:hypothetical protein